MVLLAWIGVNGADALLTGLSFTLGAMEINPFLGTIGIALGLERMLLVKLLFAMAIGGALWQRRALRSLQLLNWGMALVVVYNALIITYALT